MAAAAAKRRVQAEKRTDQPNNRYSLGAILILRKQETAVLGCLAWLCGQLSQLKTGNGVGELFGSLFR